MSAQINLYHPRFLKQRILLTLSNVALAAVVLYAILAAVGGWAWQDAATSRRDAAAAEAQLKAAKGQVEEATRAAGLRKPSPGLAADLANAEGLLRRRSEIAGLLESGAVGSTGGFGEFLRGFGRQASDGIWLTGFTIGSGGNDMEIRGSMLNPAALPDYIRRLGAEKAFQGRSFAALTMNRAEPEAAVRPANQVAAPWPAAGPAPRPIDFVLMPSVINAKEARQ